MNDLKRHRLTVAIGVALGVSVAPPTFADLNEGLVAHYPFCGNAQDTSGNEHHGIVHDATLTTDRFGNSDSAYSFDGNGSYINVGDMGDIASVSVTLWVLPEEGTYSYYRNPFGLGGLNHTERFRAEFANDWGGYKFYAFFGSGSCWRGGGCVYLGTTNYDDIPLNEWAFIVMTHDKATGQNKLYINGNVYATAEHEVILKPAKLTIGLGFADSPERYFKGGIDDFRVYSRALSDVEIESLYTGKDECGPANLATLTDFTATPTQEGISVDWETSAEVDTAGFIVWRGELLTGGGCTSNSSDYGDIVQLGFDNATGGLQSGATYSRLDSSVISQISYCYLLEDVEFDGDSQLHWGLMKSATAK
jgi:hypothetical protein